MSQKNNRRNMLETVFNTTKIEEQPKSVEKEIKTNGGVKITYNTKETNNEVETGDIIQNTQDEGSSEQGLPLVSVQQSETTENSQNTSNVPSESVKVDENISARIMSNYKQKAKMKVTGVYLEPEVERVLNSVARKGTKGFKSRLVNEYIKAGLRKDGYEI